MTIQTNILIPGSKQKPILLDIFYKTNQKQKPLVIFSHGFKGFKDWGHFNLMAGCFAEADFVFVKFNYSHNGTTPADPLTFNDLDAFANNNYSIELNDLGLVIDWLAGNSALKGEINPEKIYLLGHSRGGGLSILKAAEDRRVKKLVTWASVSDLLNRADEETVKTWKKEGVVYTYNARTKQQMPLNYSFYQDMQANKERFNVLKSAASLHVPFLIIHGTADEAVPHQEAEELNKACSGSTLILLSGENHTFGAVHPQVGLELPGTTATVIQQSIGFLQDE